MIDTPIVTQSTAQAAAVIHLRIPREEIGQVMGPAIGELMAEVASQGLVPAGPIFSFHPQMFEDVFDFEVGVPVSAPITAVGRVRPGALPARRVARTIYRGPYEGLGEGWGEFMGWIEAQNLPSAEGIWERYVKGPESGPDPATWETELNRPLLE